MRNQLPDSPESDTTWSERFIAWLSDFGAIFIVCTTLIAIMLMLYGKCPSIAMSAFCGGVIALRWARLEPDRSPWWLIAGIPGFLFFIGSSLAFLWHMV